MSSTGGIVPEEGINFDGDKSAESPVLVEYDSELIAIWQEGGNGNPWQIRAARAEKQ